MDPRLLRPFLPGDFAGDIDALWSRYRATTVDPNPHGFVTWLFHEGQLTGTQTRSVLTSGRGVLTLSSRAEAPALKGALPGHEPLGVIGRGAMGEVLIVRDRALRRTVALKRTRTDRETDEDDRILFLNEAQITAQLDHPGIVPVYGLEAGSEGQLSYTMKMVTGQTLRAVLKEARSQAEAGSLDEDHSLDARLELFLKVCDAVAYAHDHGVVHRDLKPDNVMVAEFGEVLVMDWGIAQPIPPERGEEPLRVVGTPAYMAPEQAMGAPLALEPAADQYALGLILSEIVSLEMANPGESPVECIVRAREATRRALLVAPGEGAAPRELVAIVARATQRKPRRRYASVDALADDLRRYQRDEEVSAAPDEGLQRMQRWISHHRERAVAIGFGLALAIVLMGLGVSALGEARLHAERAAAAAREAALASLSALTARQVQQLDAAFHEFEALLGGIAFAAENAMATAAEPSPPYLGLDGVSAVGDSAPSRYYRAAVSLQQPDFGLAPGLALTDVSGRVAQLHRLTPTLRTALARGSSPERTTATALAGVRERGLRLVWTYVGTADGVIVNFPGTDGGYPTDYDHREMGWYTVAVGKRGPVWNMLEADETGMGLLMTASQGLYDEQGAFQGVAALDVGFGYLIDELLDVDELVGRAEAFLIDSDALVMARSSHKVDWKTVTDHVPEGFPHADRIPASGRGAGGWVELQVDGRPSLMHWSRMHAVDWTYVIVGERAALFEVAAGL